MSKAIIEITDGNFDSVLADAKQQNKIVVVDFWAAWCGPCRAFAPEFERAAEDAEKGVIEGALFAKCNVDVCENICVKYGIQNIPTLLLFKDGAVCGKHVGMTDYNRLRELVDTAKKS